MLGLFSYEQLIEDTHILAYCYHWGREEVFNLATNERRMWVEKVLEQKQAENDAVENVDNTPTSTKDSYKES